MKGNILSSVIENKLLKKPLIVITATKNPVY